MTDEKKLELIKSYIVDIEDYLKKDDLTVNEKQHLERAYSAYNNFFKDAEIGKLDIDMLHENISSFLYMLQ